MLEIAVERSEIAVPVELRLGDPAAGKWEPLSSPGGGITCLDAATVRGRLVLLVGVGVAVDDAAVLHGQGHVGVRRYRAVVGDDYYRGSL